MEKKRITAVVFDLDGTLLDTLEDLAAGTNYALAQYGFPQRSLEEIRQFVGNGVRRLMERAVPGGEGNGCFEDVFACFKSYYIRHCMVRTAPYPGIPEMLSALRQEGYRLAIVSNKLQDGVTGLFRHYFSGTIQVAVGERPGVRRKPAPDMVRIALRKLGVSADEAVYVGDSDVDIATASGSGLPCISVLWGFRDRDFLVERGASCLASAPSDVPELLREMNGESPCR